MNQSTGIGPKTDMTQKQEKKKLICRIFLLEKQDYDLIAHLAIKMGFGVRGHSAVVRYIIRDWKELKKHHIETHFLKKS